MEIKVIQSGSIVEVYQYHQTVSLPKFSFTPKIKKYVRIKRSKADIRASSASRSRRAFMRLVNSNSGLGNQPDCFLTLTFKPEKLCSLVEANYQWKKFRQKLQRIVPNLRYCLSYEFDQAGPLPFSSWQYGVVGRLAPYIEEHPVALAIIALSPNN